MEDIKVIRLNTAVVGSGAAGFNAGCPIKISLAVKTSL